METKPHPYKSITHQEKYYHFKDLEYLRVKAMTVFARKNSDLGWWMSVAFCVNEDQFDRRIGRQIARRKYFGKGPRYYIRPEISYEAVKDIAMKALGNMANEAAYHRR